jgi:DNA polymerase-3 subunit alpha (Gram-positive type)
MPRTFFDIFTKYEPDDAAFGCLKKAGGCAVRCDRERRLLEVELDFDEIIPKSLLYAVETQLMSTYRMRGVRIIPKYPAGLLTEDYIPEILKEAERTGTVARGFFSDYNYSFDGEELIVDIETPPAGIDLLEDYETPRIIGEIIRREFGVGVKVRLVNSGGGDYSESIRQKLEEIDRELYYADRKYEEYQSRNGFSRDNERDGTDSDKQPSFRRVTTLYPEVEIEQVRGIYNSGCRKFDITNPEFVYGGEFEVTPTRIAEITSPVKKVLIAGDVFGFEKTEIRSGDKVNISFSITDYNSSIDVRCFGLEPDEADEISAFVSDGATLALYGSVKRERRRGGGAGEELYMSFSHAAKIKRIERTDTAINKRVELHVHTSMSTMDALISPQDLTKTAKKWGYKAIAVTDHATLQAYPEIMLAAKEQGVKPIYGVEGYFVNDTPSAVFGQAPEFDGEFVVFDIESTGLSAQSCKIIEIGAVLVSGGKIGDRFHTFVDPEEPISNEITRLTGIDDSMVAGAPSQTEAVSAFLEFAGGRMLVAHNADFDVGFIRIACERAGIPFDNSYLDTLALSRYINTDLKNHRLDTLADYFGLGNFRHHRAHEDAEILAHIFLCMTEKMRSLGIYSFVELVREMSENSDPLRLKTYHQVILVKNQTGLKNLYRIISESYLNYFYRTPRIPKTLLEKYREGLIVGSACSSGELFSAILENKPDAEIEKIAAFYDYLEIQPVSNSRFLIEEEVLRDEDAIREINRKIYNLGKKLGKLVVATSDAHFLNADEEIFRKILLSGMKFRDAERESRIYLRTTEELLKEFSYLGDEAAYEVVVKNTNKIADMIEDVRPIPEGFYTPSMEGAEEELQRICYERARSMYGDELPPIVAARLEKELNAIIKHGFAVLYIIAQRLVKFSEDEGYLVGSRGSVGSSFVATMAGISEVNPLPPHYWCPGCRHSEFITDGSVGSGFDLPEKLCPVCSHKMNIDGQDIPFETFLGFHGDKFPDIDLNFSGEVQGKVHKYTEELFGADNVFRAGTIGTLGDKTAYGFVKKYLESKEISLPRAELNRLVMNCVGIKRTTGQHPGGLIVIPRQFDVYDFTPVQRPADDPKSDIITTHFAFTYLHETVLKIDALGHDIPTKYWWLEHLTGIKIADVPMNDPAVYELFLSTKSLGVSPDDIDCKLGTFGLPEMGTRFIQQVLLDAKPKNFADLIQISGLTHGTNVWLGNAQELIKNNICDISQVVGTRDGIMLTLMRYGLESQDAFNIMEFVRKNKRGKPLGEDMVRLMREHNVPEWYIDSLWKIRYMFPKAHAAAYVMSAIRLGWFKVHRPLEFYCTMFTVAPTGFDAELVMKGKRAVAETLRDIENRGKDASPKEQGMVPVLQLINECYARRIRFLKVDLNKSDAYAFLPENGAIRLPFCSLSGLGGAAAQNIVDERNKQPFSSVEDLRVRAGLNKSVIEILRNNGVLDGLDETDQLTFSFA